MSGPKKSGNVIVKYLPVYFVLLAIAGLEIVLAYQSFSPGALIAILLALAFCGADWATAMPATQSRATAAASRRRRGESQINRAGIPGLLQL